MKSVIKLKLTPIVLSNHIDLCYDVLRRMFQFGKIHEIDPNKLISSTLFNPKNDAIQSTPKISIFSDMFSKRLATDVAASPEICCTIHEDLRFLVKNGKVVTSKCHGTIELSLSDAIPGLSSVILELRGSESVNMITKDYSELNSTSDKDLISLQLFTSNLSYYTIAYYTLDIQKKLLINLESKTRIRPNDKLVELELNLKSNYSEKYRATDISVQFRPPSQFINACLLSDKPAQELVFDSKLINWKISNLFGKSNTSCILSMSMSDMTYPKNSFSKFEMSFRIDDFTFSGFQVEKFKPANMSRRSINVNRKTRTFCTSSNSSFINKI